MANYREPQWLLPNEKNLQYPAAGATQGSGLSADRHSLYSMDFNSGNSDYINTDLSININSFSVSCWFKGDNLHTGTQKRLFDFADSTRTLNKFPILFTGSSAYATIGSGKIAVLDYSGSVGSISADWPTDRNGEWNHIVLLVNNTSVELYLNGSSLVSGTITRDTSYQDMTKFVIGAAANTTQYYFNGQIDEVSIFSRVLDSSEISTLYNNGSPSNPILLSGKPVAYYPLGEQARKPGTAEWRFPNEVLQGQAISFDGSGDYIDCGHSALTAISGGSTTLSTPMTISMWFKLGSSSTSKGLINFGDLNNNYGGFSIRHESNTLSFIRATQHIITGGYTFTDTTSWHNMILIYDPSNSSNCYVYIDGSDTGVTFNSNVGNIDFLNSNGTQRNLIIGAYYGLSETFTGKMSNVAIWNSDQSANIANIYNYGAPQTSYTVTPTAWYKLDKTSKFTGLNPNWHSALDFVASESDYIEIGDTTSLDDGDLSVSLWFNASSVTGGTALIDNHYVSAANAGFAMALNTSSRVYIDRNTTTTDAKINNVNMGYSLNTWHHLLMTYNDTTKELKAYLDGDLKTTVTGSASSNSASLGARIGRYSATGTGYFNGQISNAAIFNQAISAEDVKYLYNGGTPQTNISFEPVSWWKLDNTGTGIQDSGSASNNGTNNGATEVTDSVAVDEWVFENTVQSQTPNWTSALDFDSSTASYINIGTDSSLNFTTAMTFSCWARIDGASGGVYTLAANMQASPYKFNFRYYYAPAATGRYLRLQYANGSGALQNLTVYSDLIDDNWHHLAFTIDGTTNADGISIYIDNVKTSFTATGTNIQSFGSTTLIGGYQTSSTWDFEGPISNAAFWDSSLSTSQINDLYNNGQPEAVISHSPLSYYKLDNTTTGVQDSGSANNNGIIVGTIPEIQTNVWTPRLNGESDTLPSTALVSSDLQFNSAYSSFSLDFDGADDYIDCTNDSIFNLTTGMTISAWINPTVAATDKFIVAKRWSTNSYQIATAGSINPQCSVWIGTTRYDALGSTVLSAGTWYHIVGTFDGSNVKVYLNGVLEDTTAASGSLDQTTDIVSIAKGLNNNAYNFNGKIDETAIWNRALNQAEITSIYNNGYPKDITALSPISWWRLGEDAYFNGTDFTIPNKISGAPNGTSDNMTATDLVADSPGSYASGLGSSLALDDRLGEAPNSTANSLSFNMTPVNRISYPAGYAPTQVDNVYSMNFDGANDHILTTLDITSSTSFSISAWVYANSLGGYNGVASQYRAGNPSGSSSWFLETISSDMAFGIANGAGAPIYATKAFSTSTWHHVVGVWDGSQVEVYIDGVASGSPQSITAMNTATVNMAIGGIWNNGGTLVDNGMWNGKIDEVAIFDYALSARQIKQDIYNGTTSGKTADLNNISNLTPPVAWYRMGD